MNLVSIQRSDNGLAPNQCSHIVNLTKRNKLQWHFNLNSNIFTQENAFKMSSANWSFCPGGDELKFYQPLCGTQPGAEWSLPVIRVGPKIVPVSSNSTAKRYWEYLGRLTVLPVCRALGYEVIKVSRQTAPAVCHKTVTTSGLRGNSLLLWWLYTLTLRHIRCPRH